MNFEAMDDTPTPMQQHQHIKHDTSESHWQGKHMHN